MEFDQLVKKRKSVREFVRKKASWKSVLEAIDSANQGPFAGNFNPLRYLIVEDKETIDFISKECGQDWISQVGIIVVVLSDDTNLEETYGERGRVYSRQQAGAVIQTMLLKITDLGLAACWVGSYNDEHVKQRLKIPEHIQIEAILPIGYENTKIKSDKKDKKELDTALYWEKWDQKKRPALFDEGKIDYNPL